MPQPNLNYCVSETYGDSRGVGDDSGDGSAEAVAPDVVRQLAPRGDFQLAEDVAQVGAHGPRRDVERPADRLVGFAVGDHAGDLDLPAGEPLGSGGSGPERRDRK